MATPEYVTSCPGCGKELGFHVGPPDAAPWICDWAQGGCGHAWWPAELLPDARKAWRPQYHDHAGGPDAHAFIPVLHERRMAERDAARARGTSALPEWVTLMTPTQLRSLLALVPAARAALLPEAYTLRRAVLAAIAAAGG